MMERSEDRLLLVPPPLPSFMAPSTLAGRLTMEVFIALLVSVCDEHVDNQDTFYIPVYTFIIPTLRRNKR